MIALVTGASSGIGLQYATALARDYHTDLLLVSNQEQEQIAVARQLADTYHVQATPLYADLSKPEAAEQLHQYCVDNNIQVDILINNAGMGIGGPLEFSSLEDAQRQMDVNWMGMVRFLHHVVPVMRRQGSGKIICFSSIGGLMGLPYQGLYSASKFAIEGYCEALRLELRHTGVTVTVIEPGDFSTHFTAQRKSVDNPEANAAYPSYARSLASIEHDEMSGLKPKDQQDREDEESGLFLHHRQLPPEAFRLRKGHPAEALVRGAPGGVL